MIRKSQERSNRREKEEEKSETRKSQEKHSPKKNARASVTKKHVPEAKDLLKSDQTKDSYRNKRKSSLRGTKMDGGGVD